MSVISRYFGVFLGYLPYAGRVEFITYSNGTVFNLELNEHLHSIIQADHRYWFHLLGGACCFYVDTDMKIQRIKSSDHFQFD